MTTRRALFRQAVILTGGALAGCLSPSDNPSDACTGIPTEPAYQDWFDDVSNYHVTCDFRDDDLVVVRVGASGNDAYWGFEPAAVAIRPETTIRWEWTGKGGPHDVVSDTGEFSSGEPTKTTDAVFEHTFDRPGIFRYYCTPHRSMGMKGAVFVAVE